MASIQNNCRACLLFVNALYYKPTKFFFFFNFCFENHGLIASLFYRKNSTIHISEMKYRKCTRARHPTSMRSPLDPTSARNVSETLFKSGPFQRNALIYIVKHFYLTLDTLWYMSMRTIIVGLLWQQPVTSQAGQGWVNELTRRVLCCVQGGVVVCGA